jgi:hypothetical protein
MALRDLPVLMTLEAAADFLRLPRLATYEAALAGDLPLVLVEGETLVDTHQLLEDLGVVMAPAGAA